MLPRVSPHAEAAEPMITEIHPRDLERRIKRFDELIRGLSEESRIVHKTHTPMVYVEKAAYLAAVTEAIHGLEAARRALDLTLSSLAEEERAKQPQPPQQPRPMLPEEGTVTREWGDGYMEF
jgi:hypothetical protein